jgi:osmotically-inducible protein OsmY
MKSNEKLQKDVQHAIKWEPILNTAEIDVIAEDGIVTLTGSVDSYIKKVHVEDVVKHVVGVRAVVENIEVKYLNTNDKSDIEIAEEVLKALRLNWDVPDDKIKIKVEDGWVTLDGEVQWNYQKEAAKKAVRSLEWIKVLTNKIDIRPETHDEIGKEDIERALGCNWSMDDQDIRVEVSGNNVTLNGVVNSYFQKYEAERIAWNAPGVCTVYNELAIEFVNSGIAAALIK